MDRYYDRKGQPITSSDWSRSFNDKEKSVVRQTDLDNGAWVSTVWLGLNHRFSEGPPLIFETMVFPRRGTWGELDCQRYSTEEEALTGHEAMVQKWSIATIPQEEST